MFKITILKTIGLLATFPHFSVHAQEGSRKAVTDLDFDPTVRWTTDRPPDPFNRILYSQCNSLQPKRLKNYMRLQASGAAFFRDVLLNTSGNETTAEMLDYVFNGAFSLAHNSSSNIKEVSNVFDAMSRGETTNPGNPAERAPTRVLCFTKEQWAKFGDPRMGAGADQSVAVLGVMPNFWGPVTAATLDLEHCKAHTPTRAQLRTVIISHENMHLASSVRPWFGEVIKTAELLRLPPEKAIRNPNNFAMALLIHLTGCTDDYFAHDDPALEAYQRQHENDNDRELLLSTGFPPGKDANKTDLTALDLPLAKVMDGGGGGGEGGGDQLKIPPEAFKKDDKGQEGQNPEAEYDKSP